MNPSSKTHVITQSAAIDIGFYSVKVALSKTSGDVTTQILTKSFPSFAPRVKGQEQQHLPGSAKPDGIVVTVDQVRYFVGPSSINMVDGSGATRSSNENYSRSAAYKALFLGSLYYIAQHFKASGSLTIDTLVMGLPLTTVFQQADALIEMSTGTHTIPSPTNPEENLQIHVKNVTVVAQPQGAVVNYKFHQGKNRIKDDHNILVMDMGGGTFDWFLCNGIFVPNYNRCDATQIGSLNCSAAVCDQIKDTFKTSPIAMDRVDKALSNNSETFEIGGEEYMMADYWPTVRSLVIDALNQMKNKVGDIEVMDHILLTGGGASILDRVCKEVMADRQKVIRIDGDPVFSNVKGFFEIAEMVGD